jgi:hypothetical protein
MSNVVLLPVSNNTNLPGAGQSKSARQRRNRRARLELLAVKQGLPVQAVRLPRKRGGAQQLKPRLVGNVPRRRIGVVSRGQLAGLNKISQFASFNDLTLEKSVHQLIQTQFFPQLGIHRGTAKGADLTALAKFKSSVDIGYTSGASNILNFTIIPGNATLVAGYFQLAATVLDPITAPTTSVNGPFVNINPAIGFRVVSFNVKFIPEASLYTQSGAGAIGYNPDLNSMRNTDFSRANIDQLEWNMPFGSREAMIVNWMPNDSEYQIYLNASGPANQSAIQGYLVIPIGQATQFRVELEWGIEYFPTAAYRPFVDRKLPSIHPEANYHLNQFATHHWDTLIITPYNNYRQMCAQIEGIGGYNEVYSLMNHGSSGLGGQVGDLDMPTLKPHAFIPEQEDGGFSVLDSACQASENILGYNACQQPGRFANGVGKQLYNAMARDNPNMFSIRN